METVNEIILNIEVVWGNNAMKNKQNLQTPYFLKTNKIHIGPLIFIVVNLVVNC